MRPITRGVYEQYTSTWMKHWDTLGEIGAGTIQLYVQHRLREVRGKTVANEISSLRRFLEWCVATRRIAEVPAMPTVERSSGAAYKHRTRVAAPEYTPEEIWAVINALPERAGRKRWPVKARAIVAYTTTLRPATLDKLSVPEHYSKGSPVLRITADIDKESAARDVPLPSSAQEAIDAICPSEGLIFGWSRQLVHFVRPAAKVALPPHKAAVFIFQHFRSAGITHALERSANLAGVQYMAGHKDAKTTSRYVRASFRAALEVADAWGNRGTNRGTARKRRKKSA